MSLLALVAFMGRFGGIRGLLDLLDKLNNPKLTQTEVAQSYGIDPGQFSRFVHSIFEKVYIMKPEIEEYLNVLEKANHERLEDGRRNQARVFDMASYRQKIKKAVGASSLPGSPDLPRE